VLPRAGLASRLGRALPTLALLPELRITARLGATGRRSLYRQPPTGRFGRNPFEAHAVQ
jgi:hypothetical protein